jgi:uncharacterized protein with predicted RNA binding PUA domain
MHKIRVAKPEELVFLRAIADHQFRSNVGEFLFPNGVLLKISRNTGRIREVLSPDNVRIASVRASSFTFNLTFYGASILHNILNEPLMRVYVVNEVAQDILSGNTVFARHVIKVDENLRAGDEVLVVDENDKLLCVGRLTLSPYEILHFIRGAAVKLRECGRDGG